VADSVKLEMSESDWIPRKEQLGRWRVEGVVGREDVAKSEKGKGREENVVAESRANPGCCTPM